MEHQNKLEEDPNLHPEDQDKLELPQELEEQKNDKFVIRRIRYTFTSNYEVSYYVNQQIDKTFITTRKNIDKFLERSDKENDRKVDLDSMVITTYHVRNNDPKEPWKNKSFKRTETLQNDVIRRNICTYLNWMEELKFSTTTKKWYNEFWKRNQETTVTVTMTQRPGFSCQEYKNIIEVTEKEMKNKFTTEKDCMIRMRKIYKGETFNKGYMNEGFEFNINEKKNSDNRN